MKDEEMTEEEKIAEDYFCDGCENSFEHENGRCSNCTKWQFFIAGLKAGRPQWHKVADGDLPSDKHGHVVINQDCDKVTIRNGRFEYLDGCKADVIAWCEIPKYTEED